MIDDARRHEERGFEGGVVDDVEHPGHGGERRADAEQQGNQSQVADGGIGQQSLEIVLEQGDKRAQQQRDQSDTAHQPRPFRRAGQDRKQPRQQKHPRFHHGRRMQIGRHRRRCRHGIGQPKMEGKLGRLGERSEQYQRQHGQIEGVGANAVTRSQNDGKLVATGDMTEQQKSAQQGQSSSAGDGERHKRAIARFLALMPVADQQEGRQAGQLPENQQLDDVVGQGDAQHGTHEQQQTRVETPRAVPLRQVVVGIEHDQQADAQNQQSEQEAQPIQPKNQIEAYGRHPGQALDHGMAGEGRARQRQQADQRRQGRGAGHPGGVRPAQTRHSGGESGAKKRDEDDQRQTHGDRYRLMARRPRAGRLGAAPLIASTLR